MRSVWTIFVASLMALALSMSSVRAAVEEVPAQTDDAHAPVVHEPEAGAGHDAHGEKPNPTALILDLSIWTAVVFLLTFAILARFAWKPMLEGLKAREKTIQDAQDNALLAQQEAKKLQEQLQVKMSGAHEEIRLMLEEARKSSTRLQEEMLAKAKAEIQAERNRLTHDLEMARDQALRQIWDQAANLAVQTSEKTLRRKLSPDDHRRLIDEAIVDLRRATQERHGSLAGKNG